MKMHRFLLNKLIRNNIVSIFEKRGAVCKTEIVSDNGDFLELITQKISEELEEVFDSQSREELLIEVADFEEVFDIFKKVLDLKQEDIDAVRKAKTEQDGNFSDRIFAEYVDVPETDTEDLEYFRAQPDKYPEIDPTSNEPLFLDELADFLDDDFDQEDDEEEEV